MEAEDDIGPTTLMEVAEVTPQVGLSLMHDVFPDTGCYQSIISMDLVSKNGLKVKKSKKKKLRAENRIQLKCCLCHIGVGL